MEARRVAPAAVALSMPAVVPWPAKLAAPGQRLTLGLVGDPQSGQAWAGLAAALDQAKPDAVVFIGDLVSDGLAPGKWNQSFFGPTANGLTNLPWLAVIGNHDRRAPLFENYGGLTWTRELAGALLVGIDGGLDWSPASAHAQWLERTLAAATNRFKFVFSHYPAYSSRNHGKLAADGLVLERPSRVARLQLVPLLEKHGVTAMFCGHDHGYERSELPSGLTAITTAGGGGGLYPKHEDGRANPHSSLLVDKHHFGLLQLGPDEAVFTARTADGTIIDSRTWRRDKTRP
jgi:3',5'-cyclic AMP phosphodiesterase CpdA